MKYRFIQNTLERGACQGCGKVRCLNEAEDNKTGERAHVCDACLPQDDQEVAPWEKISSTG